MFDRAAIVGVGMIGGSVAAALRARGLARVISGYDESAANLTTALDCGLIDEAPADHKLIDADLVVLAVPVLSIAGVLRRIKPGCGVVTDVLSVKQPVLAAAVEIYGALPANLVPGHPIAGSERRGPGAANADLFVNHRVILTPTPATASHVLEQVTSLWQAMGAEVVEMTAARHDEVLACTSHLPHLLAYALVDTLAHKPDSDEIFRFAAGGFRDFTRIAGSDPIMWRDIFASNETALLGVLDEFTANLAALRKLIAAHDTDGIAAVLSDARTTRNAVAAQLAVETSAE